MSKSWIKKLLFVLFPRLRLLENSIDIVKDLNKYRKRNKNKSSKMRFPVKLAIGCGLAFAFIVIVGFIAFPKMIKSKVKGVSQTANAKYEYI